VLYFLFLVAMAGGLMTAGQAQTKPANAKGKPSYKLIVKDGPIITLSAKDATLAEIGSDLAKQLNTKVIVSSVLQQQPIKVEFSDLGLEPAMQLLAPQVFIDYEIGAERQVAVGIFLYGYNEPPPALNAAVVSASQALLVEGDTEDVGEPTTEAARKKQEESPLRVTLLNNKLTIRARQQSLMLVVMKVGEELGIPVEIKEETRELVSTDVVAMPVEEALQRISPNLRVYVRSDLQRLDRRPFRLVLNPPPSQGSTSGTQF
jgi:hypothetical protein